MGNFEILDHTADFRLKITGENRDDLFRTALDGLKALTEIDNAHMLDEQVEEVLDIKGDDDEELLIRFLNNLLEIIQEKYLVPMKILYLDFGNGVLQTGIIARRIGEFPEGYVEIKAATYHMLDIVPLDGKLNVTVVFDI